VNATNWKPQLAIRDLLDGTANTFMFGEKHVFEGQSRGVNGECGTVGGKVWTINNASDPDCAFGGHETDGVIWNGDHAGIWKRVAGGWGTWNGAFSGANWPIISKPNYQQPGHWNHFGSWHPGICQFTMYDGSVRAVNASLSLLTLAALADRRDGAAVNAGSF
jgi:hypothetical protein